VAVIAVVLDVGMVVADISRGPRGYLGEPPAEAIGTRFLDELPERLP
jgi:hypothetical protein